MVDVKEDSSQDLSSYDLVRQAFLLGDYAATPIPARPLDKILDYAEYWKWIECSSKQVVCYRMRRYPYLRFPVPSPEVCKRVKKVEITCVSFDRGYSRHPSRPDAQQTCWTWGDLSISLTTPTGFKEIRREGMQTDSQANAQWQVHCCSFGKDSEFVLSLVPGKSEILLFFNTQFTGWVTQAKEATIKLMFV